ncbi:MAG TPA: gliding motility-associated C-terminal domain-containing protein [Daejeonella sp.]|nr:gliding motility-associated C-terminal domain-containing protein [Daejeonella sp.]
MKYCRILVYTLLTILLNSTILLAQTCSGSLGDPVVNITFGAGLASTSPLPPGVTSYQYTSTGCPGDGFYNIGPHNRGCFDNTWHSINQDHTPSDDNGNMMIINASFTAGDFYKQTVSGLCAGTTYEFAAWVLNILKPGSCGSAGIDPNITFTIETLGGVMLGTYNTEDIAEMGTPAWKQYGLYFTSITDEVVIRMTNNSKGGCGNDLALDDITFRACGPVLKAAGDPISMSGSFCEGGAASFILNGDAPVGYISPAYQWQVNNNDDDGWQDIAGATSLSYTVNIPTIDAEGYQFRLAAAEGSNISSLNCRVVSNVIPIEANKNPTADAGSNVTIEEGRSVELNGKAEGKDLRYFWSPSTYLNDPNILNPTASPTEDITYTLTVVSEDGCNKMAQDAVSIRVLKKLIVPNAFTPNGDMVNDNWRIAALNTYPEANITVFNRYGDSVYKSVGYDREWDGTFNGKALPVGVYYYIIDLKTEGPVLKGSVSIIR